MIQGSERGKVLAILKHGDHYETKTPPVAIQPQDVADCDIGCDAPLRVVLGG